MYIASLGAYVAEAAAPDGAGLGHTGLFDACFQDAILVGATLFHMHLWGADLTGADLAYARLDGARYNERTRWPFGFDPTKAGAIREEGR